MASRAILFTAALALAGCSGGDPLERFARRSQPAPAQTDTAVQLVEASPERPTLGLGGLFAAFRRGAQPTAPAEQAVGEAIALAMETGSESDGTENAAELTAEAPSAPEVSAAPSRATEEVSLASADAPAPRGFLGRIFGGDAPGDSAPTEPDFVAGTPLPLGEMQKVCGLSRATRGTLLEQFHGYRLYDSNLNSTQPRAFYITGFKDNCARQVTGALAMFGDPAVYDQHVATGQAERSPVATSYGRMRDRVCRGGINDGCAARLARMRADVAILTVYPGFQSSTRWAEFLLDNQDLQATALHD